MNRRIQKGFTLVEVLMVVVIIGVLASLVLPRFVSQSGKAIASEAMSIMSAIRKADLIYADEQGSASGVLKATAGGSLGAGDIQTALAIAFEEKAWTYSIDEVGLITAVGLDGGGGENNSITLNPLTGMWGGAGDYAKTGIHCSILSPRAAGDGCNDKE